MSKLFNVSVKYPRSSGEKKWTVFRYAVAADSAQQAEQMVKEQEIGERAIIDIYAREIEGGVMGRDNYLAADGKAFKRDHVPLTEHAIFQQ